VAELVADHALQLVAGELLERTAGHRHHRVGGGVPGGERVDAGLVVEHVDLRHRHTRRERHLLDHVEQRLFLEVDRARRHAPAAEHLGDGRAARAQLHGAEHRAAADHQQRPAADQRERVAVPRVELAADEAERGDHRDVDDGDDAEHGEREQHDELAGLALGAILGPEEVHGGGGQSLRSRSNRFTPASCFTNTPPPHAANSRFRRRR
jgi:hypothetical protein